MKKIFILLSLTAIFSNVLFARDKAKTTKIQDKIVDTVLEGSYKDVKKIYTKDFDFFFDKVGPEQKTYLIYALEKDREFKIIKFLVKKGIKIDDLTIAHQNALMFASEFSSDPAVIELLIKKAKSSKKAREKFIMKRDDFQENCFDYAQRNKNSQMALEVLGKYADHTKSFEKKNPPDEPVLNYDQVIPKSEESPSDIQEPTPEPEPEPALPPQIEEPPVVEEPTPEPEEEVPSEKFTDLDELSDIEEVKEEVAIEEEPTFDRALFALENEENVTPRKRRLFDSTDLDDNEEEPIDDFKLSERTYIEDANKKDKFGRTPLMIASQKGDLEKMKDLLYSGADIQAKDNDGWTALMFAARYQTKPEVTDLLIKNGSVITAKNKHGISALKYAAGFNTNPVVLSKLLENRSISEKEIREAFIYAVCSSAPVAILNVFLKKGIQINVSYEGKTPLMYAAETNNNTEVISWLLENGAKVNLKTAKGKTAFDFAQENKKLPHDGVYWALNADE